jgi:hypothetical protein
MQDRQGCVFAPTNFKFRSIIMKFCCTALIFGIVFMARASVLSTSISQDTLQVGDPVHFTVSMLVPKSATVVPPPVDGGFGKFAVKEFNQDKVEKSGADSLTFKYVITLYTTEQCTLPALPFVQVQGDKKDTLFSQALPLRLVLVKDSDSTNPSIKGLKPQQSVGSPSLTWLWIMLGICLVGAVLYAFRGYFKKREQAKKSPPPKPPYEEAIDALARLDEKQYLMKGMVREYVFELSDIFKRYIERRFEVNAAEFTTEEMLDWIKRSKLESADRKIAEWFFSATDPVKFAKMLPDNDTIERFGADVRRFLEQTRPGPDAPKPAEQSHAV